MVLEATIIIVDNSEHSRNGDYLPSRFGAQCDAVNLIFSAKINSNPESSVGLMSMGGAQPEVLTTLTTDEGKIVDGLHRTKIKGSAHLSTALNVASLALKHRQNKSQHQRIIVFTCSPLHEDEKACIKLAKRLKKNTIAVDIVAFGDLGDTDTIKKIESFHENIKGSADGSHLAIIPPGNLLSDSIVATPILAGDGASGGGGMGDDTHMGGTGGGDNFGGVDPNMDPELALALRMSMEEEERRLARQEEEHRKQEGKTNLESVPEGQEGEASGGKPDGEGSSAAVDGEVKKDGGKKDDKMDTS